MKNYTSIKRISIVMCLFITLLIFTACGGPEITQTDPGTENGTDSSTQTSSDAGSDSTDISEPETNESTGEESINEADYNAVKTSSPIIVDGVISEGEWDGVEYINIAPDDPVVLDRGTNWFALENSTSADINSKIRIKWDEDFIYILEERQDDEWTFSHNADEAYLSDGALIFLELNKDADRGGVYHFFYVAKDKDGGSAQTWMREKDGTGPLYSLDGVAQIASMIEGDTYILELAVPWSAMQKNSVFNPEVGKELKLSIVITDNDGEGNWGQMMWIGKGDVENPDVWGIMKLTD